MNNEIIYDIFILIFDVVFFECPLYVHHVNGIVFNQKDGGELLQATDRRLCLRSQLPLDDPKNSAVAHARRVVIKVGSALVTNEGRGLDLAAIERAIAIQEEGLAATVAALANADSGDRPTELQLAARLEFEMKSRGATASSFAPTSLRTRRSYIGFNSTQQPATLSINLPGSAGPLRSSISRRRWVLSSSGRCMSSPEV